LACVAVPVAGNAHLAGGRPAQNAPRIAMIEQHPQVHPKPGRLTARGWVVRRAQEHVEHANDGSGGRWPITTRLTVDVPLPAVAQARPDNAATIDRQDCRRLWRRQ
jgi:hypothetical protein